MIDLTKIPKTCRITGVSYTHKDKATQQDKDYWKEQDLLRGISNRTYNTKKNNLYIKNIEPYKDEIKKMYLSGITQKDIATYFNVTCNAISYWLNKDKRN